MGDYKDFPLKFSTIDIYYIYPFVFDLQTLAGYLGDSPLTRWMKEQEDNTNPEWKLGLPSIRQGFPPILPYKALFDQCAHATWEKDSLHLTLKDLNGNSSTVFEAKEKILSIRESGNGTLTYKFTLECNNCDYGEYIKKVEDHIKLIPKLGDKLGKKKFGELPSLYHDVKDTLTEISQKLGCLFSDEMKKADVKTIWEDLKVLQIIDPNVMQKKAPPMNKSWVPFPFTYMTIHMCKQQWVKLEEAIEKVKKIEDDTYYRTPDSNPSPSDSGKDAHDIVAALMEFVYNYNDLKHWEEMFCTQTTLENISDSITTPSYTNYIECFASSRSFVTVMLDDTTDDKSEAVSNFNTEKNVPVIITSIEAAIARGHFALVLDALLDNILLRVSYIKKDDRDSNKRFKKFREQFYLLQLQTAFFLTDISQHVETGYLGSEISMDLRKVLHIEDLERKLQRKLDMTERVLLGKQLEIDDALCGLNRPAE